MITVHHLENSRSQRVLWLLEELGVEYRIERYSRHPKTALAPPELRKLHPLGKSPVVTDGDLILAESGAILEYLVETYGPQLRPQAGTPEHRRYVYWMHYAEGSLMPPLLLKLVFSRISKPPVPFFVRPISRAIANRVNAAFIDPQIKLHLGFVDRELEQHPWFAGETLSAADIQMSFPLDAAFTRAKTSTEYPHITAFLERIHARPAYQRALERGGPYQIMH